jgi:iron complex outermembrane receptor protein
MLEIGYRGKIAPALSVDVEVFDIKSKNYNSLVSVRSYTKMMGTDTVETVPIMPLNLPLKLRQLGITVSLIYNTAKLRIRPFVTFQQSRAENFAPFLNTPDAPASFIQSNPLQNNIYSGMGTTKTLSSTPAVFGGADINYLIAAHINFNLGTYYYANQTYSHASNVVFNDGIRGIDHIPAKLILNAGFSFEPLKGLHLSCSAKNMLNQNTREFFRSDAVPLMLMAGVNYEF